MLQSVNSFLSPPVQVRKTSRRSNSPPGDDDVIIVSRKDDDVIMKSPVAGSGDGSLVREFPLKVRCRADLQKIAVLPVRPFVTDDARRHLRRGVTSVWLSFSRRP